MAPVATGGLYNDREQLFLTLVDRPGQSLDLSFTVSADGNELLERGEVPPGKRHQQARERGRRMERCIDHLLEQGRVLLRELDDHFQEMLASLLHLSGEGNKVGVRLLRGFQQTCRQRLFALQSQVHDRLLPMYGGTDTLDKLRLQLAQTLLTVGKLPAGLGCVRMPQGCLHQAVKQRFIIQRRPYLALQENGVTHGRR